VIPVILRSAYSLVIGVLVTCFVAFGVQAFYPRPDYPDYSAYPPGDPAEVSEEEEQRHQAEYERRIDAFEKRSEAYNRNVFIVTTICCVAILSLCILYLETVPVIGPGLIFGAVFTLFYGLGLAFSVQDDRLRFVASGVGLAILLALAYRKFGRRGAEAGHAP